MRSKVNKIVTSALLVLCMAVSVLFVSGEAKAAELPVCTKHTTFITKKYTSVEVANYRKGDQYQIPETEVGYLFAC